MSYRYTSNFLIGQFLLLFVIHLSAIAQQDTSKTTLLDTITVTSSRLPMPVLQTPYALSVVDQFYMQTGQRQISINEALRNVPGLIAFNPDNYAQDLRVAIRGFGARAAFGIRGIKILVDGLPESTPDGQAQVDNIDLGAFRRMEVIRGSSSSLYGNAAGGVISFTSESVTQPFAELRATWGSFNLQRYQFKGGWRQDNVNGFVQLSHTRTDGYRSQNEMLSTQLYSYLNFDLSKKSHLRLIYNYVNSPKSDDPGALTQQEVDLNRINARDRNVEFDAGESVTQSKVGLIFSHQITPHQQLQVRGFFLDRNFDNKLPFGFGGIVDLERFYTGGGISYSYEGQLGKFPYRLKVGVDIEDQKDERQRYENILGRKGRLTLNQTESFTSTGIYLLQNIAFNSHIRLNIGLRYDLLQLGVQDHRLNNDNSQSFNVFNPSVGLSYGFSSLLNLYANFSTSFETPTLNELSANPRGISGFNPDLQPQNAISYELGAKGLLAQQLHYTLAVFHIDLQNELLPFELPPATSTFFNNVGQSTRQGVELSLDYAVLPQVTVLGSYTLSHFTFKNFPTNGGDNLSGKRLPGVPQHMGYIELRYAKPRGLYAAINMRSVGSIFANNNNSVEDPGYQITNLKIGWQKQLKNWSINPFFGVNNLFNIKYTANLRINAFGNRFYEPGAGINFYGGIKIRVN